MNAVRWFSLCATVLALTLTSGVECIGSGIKVKTVTTGGLLHSVSVGPAGVWGVNKKHEVFYREDTYDNPADVGRNWTRIDSSIDFNHIDVGDGIVWGVAKDERVYYRSNIDLKNPTGDDWKRVAGHLVHVTVSPVGYVWGVDKKSNIFYRKQTNYFFPRSTTWFKASGFLVQISAGYSGVWGVTHNKKVYYLEDSFGDVFPPSKTNWIHVDGSMVYISSGNGYVSAIDDKGQVYLRMGGKSTKPVGEYWAKVIDVNNIVALDSYGQTIWAVDKNLRISKNDIPAAKTLITSVFNMHGDAIMREKI